MSVFTALDENLHVPPTDARPGWEESWSLDWSDADSGTAGGHRFRSVPSRGLAVQESWIACDVKVHSDTRTVDVAARGDLASSAGHIAGVRSIEPLRSFAFAGAGSVGEMTFDAFTDFISFSMSGQRVDSGLQRYESFGKVVGVADIDGRHVPVSGLAIHRHAWGVPNPDARPIQSVHGVFGEDLFFSIDEYRTESGRASAGYLFEDGEFHGVEKARFRTAVDASGLPSGCDLLIATADRRDFRIPGVVTGAAANASRSLGFSKFDLARRSGSGVLEVFPAPSE